MKYLPAIVIAAAVLMLTACAGPRVHRHVWHDGGPRYYAAPVRPHLPPR